MNTQQEFKIEIKISDLAQTVINNLKAAVKKSPTGVSFRFYQGYENKQGEVSNNLINIGMNYGKAKLKDIKTLENLDILSFDAKSDKITLEKARIALIEAFKKPNKAQSEAQINAYTNICPGLRVHLETGEIYIYGYRENKTILKAGEYKTVKSRDLTIAKNELRKTLSTGKFTNFKVANMSAMKLNGNTLEF